MNCGTTSGLQRNVGADSRPELLQAKGLGDERNGSRLECRPLQVRPQPPGAENELGGLQCRLAAGPAAEFQAVAVGQVTAHSHNPVDDARCNGEALKKSKELGLKILGRTDYENALISQRGRVGGGERLSRDRRVQNVRGRGAQREALTGQHRLGTQGAPGSPVGPRANSSLVRGEHITKSRYLNLRYTHP